MGARSTDGSFATTRWSLVISAADRDAPGARASLMTLCLRYWYPVYAYLRRSGHAPERAHALALSFFDSLLQTGLDRPEKQPQGRFRLFLLGELHRFLSDDAAHAPRTSSLEPPPLHELEARHQAETLPQGSPEDLLRRGFAVEVVAAAHLRLREEAREAGHLAMFEALCGFLASEPRPGDYEAIAGRLQVRPLFLAMAVKRLRERFRELVDHELSQTLASGNDLDAERAALMQSLGEPPP